MIDSAVEKREMEHKHALIQQRVSPEAESWPESLLNHPGNKCTAAFPWHTRTELAAGPFLHSQQSSRCTETMWRVVGERGQDSVLLLGEEHAAANFYASLFLTAC